MKIKTLIAIPILLLLALFATGCSTIMPSSAPGIAADGETAYLSGGSFLYAIRLSDGEELWRYPQKADAKVQFYAPPVLSPDGQLIVGGYDHVLYSLDPQTGAVNWTFAGAKDRWIGGVLVAGDLIYAPNADHRLYLLNLDGELQSTFETEQPLWAAPVTDGVRIYLASLDHHIYALTTGGLRQAWDVTLDGTILGSPVLAPDGTLYVGTFAGSLYALDAATGDLRWESPVKVDGWIWSAVALEGEALYFGDSNGAFHSVNALSGEKNWQIQPDGAVLGSPMPASEVVLFATESGTLYAVDRQGDTAWREMIGGQLYGTPILAGDLILVAPTKGEAALVALDHDGVQKWAFIPAK